MENFGQGPFVTVDQALAGAPHALSGQDIWLFAYGAMLEDPPFAPVDRQVVACPGWRRAFCLSDPGLRGTPDDPGLTLGLLEGGHCVGVAWRLAAQTARQDLHRVLTLETKLPFYRVAWLPIHAPNGRTTALALIADTCSALFAPGLAEEEVIRRLATCRGVAGPNADYLRDALAGLDSLGLADIYLSRLWSSVRNTRQPSDARGPAGRG